MFILNRFILSILILLMAAMASNADYQVKTIYFIPKDSKDGLSELDLDTIMKSIRDTYKQAMENHGFNDAIYQLETDNDDKIVIHKVIGNQNKSHYNGNNTYYVVESELKQKGYDGRNSIYVTIMADMSLLMNGNAVGLAGAVPQGGFFNDRTYWAYCMIAEKLIGNLESYIAHELAHCFALSHIYDDAEYIMGGGDKLLFEEARWLSRNHYFNKFRNHSKAPDISKIYPLTFSPDDDLEIKADISDNDGLFQVYGEVNSYTIGWDLFVGDVKKSVLEFDDVEYDHLSNHKSIIFRMMDSDGNWKWHGPIEYDIPERKPNKNETLNQINDSDDTDNSDEDDDIEWNVRLSNRHLSTSWARIKSRF